MLNEDYKEMLQLLIAENVKFILGRIDIITGVSGLSFEPAYLNSVEVEFEGLKINIPSLENLIRNKKASGGTKDMTPNGPFKIFDKCQKKDYVECA